MTETSDLTIVIQAGGQSSRMGQDKALMPFDGQPLIARQVQRLSRLAGELLVTTNRPDAYRFLDRPLVEDVLPGRGALGGVYTALYAARTSAVAIVACDMPFISPVVLRAEYELLEREAVDVVIPRSPVGLEPLHAVFRRETCLPVVLASLEAGERKIIAWFPAVRVREMTQAEVAGIDPGFRSFINVNSPEEFQQAEILARQWAAEAASNAPGEHTPRSRSGGHNQPG